jgi:hypothetical protein
MKMSNKMDTLQDNYKEAKLELKLQKEYQLDIKNQNEIILEPVFIDETAESQKDETSEAVMEKQVDVVSKSGQKALRKKERKIAEAAAAAREKQRLNEEAASVQKKFLDLEKEREPLLQADNDGEVVNIPYLKQLEFLLKTYTALQSYPEEQKTKRIDDLMNKFNNFKPHPSDLAFTRIDRDQREQLIKIIIDHGTVGNVKLWQPFFESYYMFENDNRVRTKDHLTRHPYISTNKSYPMFLSAMKYYMNEAMKRDDLEFNLMVLSRIVTLLDRRKLEFYFQELSEVGKAMVNYDEILNHVQVWIDLNQVLSDCVVFRIQSISEYVNVFLAENGYNPFTCRVVKNILRDATDYVNRQNPTVPVKIKLQNFQYKFKLNWKQKDEGHKAFDKMKREFEAKCSKMFPEEIL